MTATVTRDVQEQVLGIVRKSQEMTLDAIKQVVETVNTAAEKLPTLPFAGKLTSRPHLPGASALPGAGDGRVRRVRLPRPAARGAAQVRRRTGQGHRDVPPGR